MLGSAQFMTTLPFTLPPKTRRNNMRDRTNYQAITVLPTPQSDQPDSSIARFTFKLSLFGLTCIGFGLLYSTLCATEKALSTCIDQNGGRPQGQSSPMPSACKSNANKAGITAIFIFADSAAVILLARSLILQFQKTRHASSSSTPPTSIMPPPSPGAPN